MLTDITFADLPLANDLWQSSLCAIGVWALTLVEKIAPKFAADKPRRH
jgi:hypothetical protein